MLRHRGQVLKVRMELASEVAELEAAILIRGYFGGHEINEFVSRDWEGKGFTFVRCQQCGHLWFGHESICGPVRLSPEEVAAEERRLHALPEVQVWWRVAQDLDYEKMVDEGELLEECEEEELAVSPATVPPSPPLGVAASTIVSHESGIWSVRCPEEINEV